MASQNARQDQNRFPTLIGVGGTAGTADASGTADIVQIGVNPDTGALYVQDLSGASGTTTVQMVTGTITTGSIANVGQVHNAGTLQASTNNIGDVDIATGTVTLVSGVTTVSNLTNGSVNILTGTIQSSGTTTGVGVVSNLTNGSINVLTGTTTLVTRTGNVGTLELGSVVVTSLPSSGTLLNLANGTLAVVTTVSNLTNGSVNLLTGTVTSVTNLAGGTIQSNPKPSRSIFTYGTTTTGTIGTLVAAGGGGVKIWINDASVVSHNGTVDALISYGLAVGGGGATGGGVVIRGNFGAQGGLQKSFPIAIDGGTSNTALTFNQLGGSGTVTYTVSYWTE